MIPGITLDTGALIAYEKGSERTRAALASAANNNLLITVPAPALAQAWRSNKQYWLKQLLGIATIEPLDELLAYHTGELLRRTKTTDIVDAAVAVSAAKRGDVILTSDPTDLIELVADLRSVRVVQV